VDDDALAVEAILEIGTDAAGYLLHDHTLRHLREAWQSLVFRPTPWLALDDELAKEKEHLARARQAWQDNLATYQPPDLPDDVRRELTRICECAKRELA